jgi:hypothetical protein
MEVGREVWIRGLGSWLSHGGTTSTHKGALVVILPKHLFVAGSLWARSARTFGQCEVAQRILFCDLPQVLQVRIAKTQ